MTSVENGRQGRGGNGEGAHNGEQGGEAEGDGDAQVGGSAAVDGLQMTETGCYFLAPEDGLEGV